MGTRVTTINISINNRIESITASLLILQRPDLTSFKASFQIFILIDNKLIHIAYKPFVMEGYGVGEMIAMASDYPETCL